MKTKYTEQAGFGIIGILVVVAVALVLSGSGYVVYHAHHKKSPESTSTTTSQSTTQTTKTGSGTTSAVSYFTITEWGVRAPYSGSDLTYSTAPGSSSEILLESKQLDGEVTSSELGCTAGNAGRIGRYLPTDTIPSIPPQQTAQAYLSQDFAASNSNPPTYAKVGDYYYIYWESTGDCTTDTTIINQAQAAAKAIVSHLAAVK